ncbi:hypothetical protein NHH03_08430 [Stieleria sp. TO1_6]|uniref:hypothetical protein n=1 Tax=Stieleria tagensis TaxID=2956795 RepID=UPI00209BACAA|nr:hypothetical protein [Stieleria tagensis]MCO8121760.1 hypothetical protein [Stieleria tagensis]
MNATGKRILVGTAILMLGLYALASVRGVWSAADRLQLDRQDLAELRQKLGEIRRVADAPAVVALDLEPADSIVNRIDAALQKADLPPQMLANQTPMQPQRMGQSDFMLRKVDIKLNATSVAKIVAFCDALKDETTGSVVRDLQLYDPQRSGGQETWKSQLTLTQVIFSPKSDS